MLLRQRLIPGGSSARWKRGVFKAAAQLHLGRRIGKCPFRASLLRADESRKITNSSIRSSVPPSSTSLWLRLSDCGNWTLGTIELSIFLRGYCCTMHCAAMDRIRKVIHTLSVPSESLAILDFTKPSPAAQISHLRTTVRREPRRMLPGGYLLTLVAWP